MEVELFLSLLFIIIIIDMKNWTKREMESIQISAEWTNDTMAYKSIIEEF